MKLFKIIETKKAQENDSLGLAGIIYQELEKSAVGYDQRIKSSVLMKKYGINDNKTFRTYIQEIRQNENFKKIICSEAGVNGGYWIANSKQEIQDTLDHLYKRSMEMLKTYSRIKKKGKKYEI